MRRTAAVLAMLLTAPASQAGVEERGRLDTLGHASSCCVLGPVVFVFALVISHLIYDWRKGRRPPPPPE